ncbi:Asp-tRNA(Asn)/Glu-tRNA(Gln) amidotransferase subunit GatC [Bartonella sp. DGB2]|uniref:Asp-tRNA(Asn)/Glu-tRNA(Gln) amidotransferase subunit GatC n=1 Tax=Bartonella sp. DGB2 TaxID=3388426 RepID=UPI0039900426
MSVDNQTVKRVAHLARIAIRDEELGRISEELNAILGFVEQLNEVDVEGVPPLISVQPMALRLREDIVSDGHKVADILNSAPMSEEGFFVVAKVVE